MAVVVGAVNLNERSGGGDDILKPCALVILAADSAKLVRTAASLLPQR